MGNLLTAQSSKLLEAIQKNEVATASEIIKEHKEKIVNIKLCGGRTNPLCRATWLDHRDIAKLLIKYGADINTPSIDGKTPLIWAAMRHN